MGTIATVLQLLHMPDNTVKVLVEGIQRARIIEYKNQDEYLVAAVELVATPTTVTKELEVSLRSLMIHFEEYVKLGNNISLEMLASLVGINDPDKLVDTIAAHIKMQLSNKQKILESCEIQERIEILIIIIAQELEVLSLQKKIRNKVDKQLKKGQRQFYLNEQMKAIQKELGDLNDVDSEDLDASLASRIEKSAMPPEAKTKAQQELQKLQQLAPFAPEAGTVRNYLECMLSLPWQQSSILEQDLNSAELSLNVAHYGLDKVKERILEYLAVQQRVKRVKGPIICLVGPPGVGKTSLGKSIAAATGRAFARISLGGIRDEAEIRGHRKTYVGAMPGKILQKLAKSKVNNPLFLLDEIDKMAVDARGDPASALLEVLDPEQNSSFNDHYLEVDYDLSEVMFVATANSLNIPGPLRDRMEIIYLSGYTENEKMHIAKSYLLPKQLTNHGLKSREFVITPAAILNIIRCYTREAGVRNLERELAKIARKVVKRILLAKESKANYRIGIKNLEEYLGIPKYRFGVSSNTHRIGQVVGLAWTEAGGEILTIEASAVPGTGKILSTGKLGSVMQESIQAAMTVVRSKTKDLGIAADFYAKNDMHIHVPEGATPKDGPSAGIGMCTALVSALTGRKVKSTIAMTGEITLRGEILPIGGLKEKLLAAKRAGINQVIIPAQNAKDLSDIATEVYSGIKIYQVRWIEEVLKLALMYKKTTNK
ncbi:MAG: endopeptidase La [Legionellales bacterium]|nr:MAG: endopeptidase La [Legionellales bacterium]